MLCHATVAWLQRHGHTLITRSTSFKRHFLSSKSDRKSIPDRPSMEEYVEEEEDEVHKDDDEDYEE